MFSLRLLMMILLIFSLLICSIRSNSESFLEKQKRLAEEQWKREQEESEREKVRKEQEQAQGQGQGQGGEKVSIEQGEYYYYYEGGEGNEEQIANSEDAVEEYGYEEPEPPPPPPKKHGYKSSSATMTNTPVPFFLEEIVEEIKGQINCLTAEEISYEFDRISGKNVTKKKSTGIKGKESLVKEIEKDISRAKKGKETPVPKGKETPKGKEGSKGIESPGERKSFQQIQEERKKEREEEELLKNQVDLEPGFQMGPSCESRVCAACEIIVEDFAKAVYSGIDDPKYDYIYDITEDFCDRKDLRGKYTSLISTLCPKVFDEESGNRNLIVIPFEEETSWGEILSAPKLLPKKKKICLSSGLCPPSQYTVPTGDLMEVYEREDKCILCHAFARDVEARVSMQMKITEGSAVELIQQTCDHLTLTPELRLICETMIVGKLADDIGWIAKLHSESIQRKKLTKVSFPTKLCQEIEFCQKSNESTQPKEEEIDAPYW